jgi:hypothetical protein
VIHEPLLILNQVEPILKEKAQGNFGQDQAKQQGADEQAEIR